MNVSFIVHFYLGKYSRSLGTFSTQLVFWRKWTSPSLFIFILENTAAVSILFQHSLYFKRKWTSPSLFISVMVNKAPVSILFQHSLYFEENERLLHCSFLSWKIKLQSRYFFNTACILKKMNVSFIVHFCHGKYSFSFDTFSTQLVFWRKWTFPSMFISVMVNKPSVSIPFQHSLYFEENERFLNYSFLSW